MAAYKEITVKARFSSAANYDPEVPYEPTVYDTGSGTYKYEIRYVSAATAGTTIELGMYATVTNILLKNKDATNYVELTFRTTGGGANNQVLRVPAGSFAATGSAVTVANDLVLTAN